MHCSRQFLVFGLMFSILLGADVARLLAKSSGGTNTLPPSVAGVVNTSGLTLTLDCRWVPNNGYRPVNVLIKPLAPLTADRELEIAITPFGTTGLLDDSIRVRRKIVVPAGSAGEGAGFLIPQWEEWQALKVDVFENGKPVQALEGLLAVNNDNLQTGSTLSTNAFGESPSVLALDIPNATLDALALSPLQGDGNDDIGILREARFLSAGATDPNGTTDPSIPLNQLPDRWLCYSGFDAVLLPYDRMEDLVKNHPAQWAAIRRSIAAGGNLWVDGVGRSWEKLAEVERLLDIGPSVSTDEANYKPIGDWRLPGPRPDKQGPVAVPQTGSVDEIDNSRVETERPAAKPKLQPDPGFILHDFGRGQVAAIAAADVFAAGAFDWYWFSEAVGENRLRSNLRCGVVLEPGALSSNADNFWEFLIPGVGLTPVLQFQIMISLFVIAIGPVNYWLLRRKHRLNLLPLTVGVSAALVTLALFGYAFIHDGLGVRVRVRSFTQLDQRRGEAVSWSRMSYYAGLSPSRGLAFSSNVAVYPLRPAQQTHQFDQEAQLQMEWVGDGASESQHLSNSWLPARTPTQLVTARSAPSKRRLNISHADQGTAINVENRLGTHIRTLLVSDAAGHVFQADNLDDESRAKAAQVEPSKARFGVASQILSNDLQLPAYIQSSWNRNYSGNPQPAFYRNGSPVNVATPEAAESILERSLHHASDLPPRSFVAITDTDPEVELGVAAHEEASLHVVVGNW